MKGIPSVIEPSVDRTNAAHVKAQANVKRKEIAVAEAKTEVERKDEKVAVAESAKRITVAQREDAASALTAIDAKARTVDPNDNDAIRWLASEHEQTRIR